MAVNSAQKRMGWHAFASFARRLKRRSLAPIITPEQLHTELIRATAIAMIKIGIPLQLLVALSVARAVWVTHEYHPSVFATHMLSMIAIYATGIIFILRDKPIHSLLGIIITSMAELYIQMVTTRNPALFGVILPVVALPAIVLPRRRMVQLTGLFTLGFLILIVVFPFLQTKDWPSGPILTWGILIGFMSMGSGIQAVLREYAATKDAHEEEAITRVRVEEHNRALVEHNTRLLFAQHDLRGPCNTVLGTIEVLQMPALDEPTRSGLLLQLEPVALQLRARIDSLFDQAKTPLLEAQANLPVIDIAMIARSHLPELRRMAGLVGQQAPTLTLTIPEAEAGFSIRGRVGEIQRILENLVLNATNVEATTIEIHVHQLSTEVEVSVKDNGPGFPTWMLSQPVQIMATQREQGTGLGLAGVVANVEVFGGTIQLMNTDMGACVTMRFPLASTASMSESATNLQHSEVNMGIY